MSNYRRPPAAKRGAELKVVIAVVVALVLCVVMIALAALLGNRSTGGGVTLPTEEVTPVAHGATGKTREQDQRDVLAAAVALIQEAGVSPDGKNATDRLTALAGEEGANVVSPKLDTMIRFPPETPETIKTQTYQALITLNAAFQQVNGTQEVKTKDDAYKEVFVDQAVGQAWVPLEVLTGSQATLTLQMLYADGQWRFAPFDFMEKVQMNTVLAELNARLEDKESGASSSPTATPSP